MPEPLRCPQCAAEIPSNAPAGLCPKCLFQAGLESQPGVAATQSSPVTAGFVPPSLAEMAQKFPQLEILALLGKGGMGAVYKARQPGLDRLVAIKILPAEISHDPTFSERFTREARALARLSHPNIVAIYDFGQSEGLYFFVMEYVDGVNLRQAIQGGGMTPQTALAIVPQICDALQFAHDEGIVHRDIKPENILIDKRGRVKIADFGLAKLLGREQADHALTQTRQVMGTLRYMAPEQMEGSHEVDHRADIYSLGVVFYELLTGELPIGRFAPPSKKVQIDVRLDEVVLRALEKEPEQRYQHASELKTSVDHITATPDESAGRAPPDRKMDPLPASPDARLSRCALIGAIWASYFFAALLVMPVVYLDGHRYRDSDSAMPTMMPVEAGVVQIAVAGSNPEFQSLIAQALPSWGERFPQLVLIFALAVAGLIAIAAPFGTTILGCIATGQIRRSAGRLYGLPLAVFDGLLFPLLLLDGLIVVAIAGVTMAILTLSGARPVGAISVLPEALTLAISLPISALSEYFGPIRSVMALTVAISLPISVLSEYFGPIRSVMALTLAISLPISAWIDFRIIRAVWRSVTGFQPPPKHVVAATLPGRGASIEPHGDRPRNEADQRDQHAGEVRAGFEGTRQSAGELSPPAMPPNAVAGTGPLSPPSSGEAPRFSRLAIIAAIWAPLFFSFFIYAMFRRDEVVSHQVESPQPSSTQPTNGSDKGVVSPQRKEIAAPPAESSPVVSAWWQWLLIVTLVPLGLASPFGTTILGAVALTQIRHSRGRLYGLWLALCDVLFYPLLVVDAVIAYLLLVVAPNWIGPDPTRQSLTATQSVFLKLFLVGSTVVLILVIDVLVIFFASRASRTPVGINAHQSGATEIPKV